MRKSSKTSILLHDGIITDCHIPHPWWTLHGKLFDIVPDDRAVTHNGIFHLRRVPIFYFPYFYKALKKEPRKSGFLAPKPGTVRCLDISSALDIIGPQTAATI